MCWENRGSRRARVGSSDMKTCCRKRSRGIGKWLQNILSVENKKKWRHDQIVPGCCHRFLVVTIIISYWDLNRTVDCFCSSRGMSDALADFIPLRFSFLFDSDKKTKTHSPPGDSHMFSICSFVKTGGAKGLRPTVGSLSFHAPLSSLSATVASTRQTLNLQTSH